MRFSFQSSFSCWIVIIMTAIQDAQLCSSGLYRTDTGQILKPVPHPQIFRLELVNAGCEKASDYGSQAHIVCIQRVNTHTTRETEGERENKQVSVSQLIYADNGCPISLDDTQCQSTVMCSCSGSTIPDLAGWRLESKRYVFGVLAWQHDHLWTV